MKNSDVLTNVVSKQSNSREIFTEISKQFIYFVLGIFVSRGTIFGNYSPFAASFVSAIPYKNIWTLLCGSIAGYIFPPYSSGSIRYISAVIAIAAIRWTLNDLKKVRENYLFAPIITFIPILATGIAMSSVDGMTISSVFMSLIEALFAALVAYFVYITVNILKKSRNIFSINQKEFMCIFVVYCIIILSLSSVSFGFISIGRVFAILAILLCSNFASVIGGSIAGTASGLIFSLSSPSLSYLAGAYAFGGMVSGFFSSFGKLIVCITFIVSNAIISFQTGKSVLVVTSIYETLVASTIFMLLPNKLLNKISGYIKQCSKNNKNIGLKKLATVRLDFIGKSLCSVGDSVDTVSKKLEDLSSDSSKIIYQNTIDNVCSRCGLKIFCHQKERTSTMKVFSDCTNILLNDKKIEIESFPEEFVRRCSKIGEVTECMIKSYETFKSNEISKRRINEVKSIVSGQFSGMGEILSDMSKEFENFECFDVEIGNKISEFLKSKGIVVIDSICRFNKFNRVCVEIETAYINEKILKNINISKNLSSIIGRNMDTPSIISAPNRCRIQISEKPAYKIKIGSAQHICNNGTLCGDSYSYFNDGEGRVVVMICDGMGTGGRAAIDGAMASDIMSRLSRAGMSFESALKIVNSALFIKSSEESLATVDIACIDLFTGKVNLMKAGAPLTFIKKENRITKFENPSLPVGILSDVNFTKEDIILQKNDTLLMVSDGALALGEKFLENELKRWEYSDIQNFSQSIIDKLNSSREDTYDDDITVIAIKIESYK